jgi:hypothetical protein
MPPLRSALLLLLLLPLPLPHLPALWRSTAAAVGRRKQISSHKTSKTTADASGECSSSSSRTVPISAKTSSVSSSSSSSWVYWYHPSLWWQQPAIRQAVIAAQRIVPLLAAAVAAGAPHSSLYYDYTLRLSLWSGIGKYVYQGWMQYMLAVSGATSVLCYMALLFHN